MCRFLVNVHCSGLLLHIVPRNPNGDETGVRKARKLTFLYFLHTEENIYRLWKRNWADENVLCRSKIRRAYVNKYVRIKRIVIINILFVINW